MDNVSAFPRWDIENNEFIDGSAFQRSEICSKQARTKCQEHYQRIKGTSGFHECPAGFTSYNPSRGNAIYTNLKVNGYYNLRKTKGCKSFLPVMPSTFVLNAIRNEQEAIAEKNANKSVDSDMIDFSIHEIRRFNADIKAYCEELTMVLDRGYQLNTEDFNRKLKSIFASSSLISVRLNAFDFEENPEVITAQNTRSSGIFKKFQKASRCLDSFARDKSVRIDPFIGASHFTIDMYRIFDLIPFVILENAIKYSPADQGVTVKFEEFPNSLSVTVNSIGPYCSKEEIEKIFNKKFRGCEAKKKDKTGGGYGLYFAKAICDLHGIKLSVSSEPSSLTINDVNYGEFSITLEVNH
ncbi:sensor histidine kinase [Vibrio parahaemolyticus]|nr:sensor histidine kinase [Vibrio parahaemolyticus]